ncbi:hypothetical protein V6N13_029072 [Hibiscus sabdariffa]|uniref:Uncharacterized protein n=2 Tax=Hibiscus sabdariffa TaxID=183260 RepID=A0ABR2TBH6_9ROSI
MSDKGKGIAKDDAEARQTRSRYDVAGSSSSSRYNNITEGSTWIRERRRDPSTAIDRAQQEEEARRLMPPPPLPPPRTPPTRHMPFPRPRPSSLRRIKIKFRPPGPSKAAVMSLPEAPGPVQLKGKGALKDMQQMLTKALLIASDFSGSSTTSAPPSSSGTSHFPSQLPICGQFLRHFRHLFEDPPRRRYRLVKITDLDNIEDDNEEKVAKSAGGINIRDPQPPCGEGATSAGGINIREPQQQPSGESATSAGGINIRDPPLPSGEGATSAGGINIREPQPPSGETNSERSTEAGQGNDGSSRKETD